MKRQSVISADSQQRYVLIKLIAPSLMQRMAVTAPHNGAGLLPSFIKRAGFLKCNHFLLFFKCICTYAHTHTHTHKHTQFIVYHFDINSVILFDPDTYSVMERSYLFH